MNDQRIGLKNGTTIDFKDGKNITITEEIGRGASCIVYDGFYLDEIGIQHRVRVKECYPTYLIVNRDEKKQLIASENNHSKFETVKKNFLGAYKRNANIRNTLGMTNSTINSTEITSCNNTVYIRMELDEGSDYGKYEDGSLKSLFVHIKSLAQLIQKYHQNGYLYLDIKPENIFILPETDEHIILFDFDSVITLDELAQNTEIELSHSKGFSPPEQVQGQINKIGRHTDIYSIGALTFYKLFNRTAVSQECKISSTYPFKEMNYANEKYHPRLYRTLDTFFRKTLSIAIAPRWHDIQQVIDQLDELIKLSDIDEVYLLDSFQYDSAHFIGREQEIEEIADILSTNQLVFLSGIGGIGKTELAKQYANKYHSQYDTVTFSVFEKNIETLVCDEILIHKIERDEQESDADYFERKIGILKQIATPRDLIIIDNFDVDSDEKLEILFRCPCKFIITTRMNYSDYNYKQIYVDRLQDPGDVLELFYTYNNKDYEEDENNAVEKLVRYVDYHTMTVELMAKYLRNSEELPTELYGKFLQKEGTANTGDIDVKQRKDLKLRSESVNNHLRILFDVSRFDSAEQEIIRSLSLLAGIRIEKSKFHQLCAVEDGENKLEFLIRSGWVEYYAATKKISLHQVIQDLVYKELAPNAENCSRIVEGMGKYVDSEAANDAENKVRNRFFEIFMERLSGNTLPYAKLCLEYGKENRLEEAEKICLDYYENEAFHLLQKIYREKIKIIGTSKNEQLSEFLDIPYASDEELTLIGELLDKVIFYCQKYSEQPDYLVKEYIKTGTEINSLLNNNFCSYSKNYNSAIDNIYKKIINMFDAATERLPLTSYSVTKKKNFYKKLRDFFYSDKTFNSFYNYSSDLKKAYRYQELMDQLKEDTTEENILEIKETTQSIHNEDISNRDLGKKYEQENKYNEAIECYKKDCQKGNEEYLAAMQDVARVYFTMGNIDAGISCLEELVAYLNEQNQYSRQIFEDLIEKLIEKKEFKKAKEYAKDFIAYEEPDTLSGDDPDSVSYTLSAYYFLYLSEQEKSRKDAAWKKCLKYYTLLGDKDIDSEIYNFIVEYLDKKDIGYKAIMKILNRIAGSFTVFEFEAGAEVRKKIIQQSIKKYTGKRGFKKYHVRFLVELAKLADVDSYEDMKEGQKNCENAQEYYDKYNLKDKYIQSLIYKTKADLIQNDKEYGYQKAMEVKGLCDFKLLAKQKISDHNYDKEDQVEIWYDAAHQYQSLENYDMVSTCLIQALKILKPILNQYEFSMFPDKYLDLMEDLIYAYIQMNRFDSAYLTIIELYNKAVEYLTEVYDPDSAKKDSWDEDEDMDEDDLKDDNEDMDEDDLEDEDDWEDEIDDYFDDMLEELEEDEDTINLDEITEWFDDIAKYFIEISKFDDAVRTYLVTMYLVLTSEADSELLKYGNNIHKDIAELCTIIDKLLDEEIEDNIADPLVDAKDGILECKDSCSIDTNVYESIITKISKKCQYQSIEFKR